MDVSSSLTAHPSILDGLASLGDKSLVRLEPTSGDDPRYSMLETIRAFALEQLVAEGEDAAVRHRHAAAFLALAERAAPELTGPRQPVWLNRLERDYDNVRAALEYVVEQRLTSIGLRLGVALRMFWRVRGYRSEAHRWLSLLLELEAPSVPSIARASILHALGNLAYSEGELSDAWAFQMESLSVCRDLGDRLGIAAALTGLGYVAHARGDLESARAMHDESLSVARAAGDVRGVIYAVGNLGWLATNQGDYEAAHSHHAESLALATSAGDRRGAARALTSLGYIAHVRGDLSRARLLYEESLGVRRELGDRWGVAHSLMHLGWLSHHEGDNVTAVSQLHECLITAQTLGDRSLMADALEVLAEPALDAGQPGRAAGLLAAADTLREAIGAPRTPNDAEAWDRDVAAARTELGEEAFAAVWAAGRAMSADQAVAFALRHDVDVAERVVARGLAGSVDATNDHER
jgi:tetratricopeptide (TPR) repeat protein